MSTDFYIIFYFIIYKLWKEGIPFVCNYIIHHTFVCIFLCISLSVCVCVYLSLQYRLQPPPVFFLFACVCGFFIVYIYTHIFISMSGSAAIGAMATGTILAGLIITTSKPENPAMREANWRY